MFFQIYELLSDFIVYLGPIIYIGLYVAILIFGFLIRKKNSYTYGLFFMISAIFSIVSWIINLAIFNSFFFYNLYVNLGLSASTITIILIIVNLLFLSLNVASAVFLFLAIYKTYETHKINRIEQKIN